MFDTDEIQDLRNTHSGSLIILRKDTMADAKNLSEICVFDLLSSHVGQ